MHSSYKLTKLDETKTNTKEYLTVNKIKRPSLSKHIVNKLIKG